MSAPLLKEPIESPISVSVSYLEYSYTDKYVPV